MKRLLVAIGLALGFHLGAGETLRLKLEADREYVLKGPPQEVVVKIDLSALAEKARPRRLPLNLAVVLDRSGSMAGAKIEKARQAAMGLVDQLRPGDTFALITYSDDVQIVFPSQEVRDKEALKERIARIEPGGSTALHAGVRAGADQLEERLSSRKINRVMLLSDGLANVGPSTPAALRNLGRSLSERGISVTTIGVGDDYNETLMSGLAAASDANYYYVQDAEKLPEIFAKELGELLTIAARELRIEILCPPGVKPIELIGRPEQFENQRATVQLSHLTASQNRYLFMRCQIRDEQPEVARVTVRYRDELHDGAERTLSDCATIRFTADKSQAANSLRSDVIAQKELVVTAVAKDAALVDADAGKMHEAASRLLLQATVLTEAARNAPASSQARMRQEIQNLNQYADDLKQERYTPAKRKAIQNEAWSVSNSK
jgi:Ca-activated chloride channel family protein